MKRHVPLRTCVGCKTRVPQAEVLRVVLRKGGELVVDSGRRESGRGAWVHSRANCIHAASQGGFARSFRRGVVVSEAAKAALAGAGLPAVAKSGAQQ